MLLVLTFSFSTRYSYLTFFSPLSPRFTFISAGLLFHDSFPPLPALSFTIVFPPLPFNFYIIISTFYAIYASPKRLFISPASLRMLTKRFLAPPAHVARYHIACPNVSYQLPPHGNLHPPHGLDSSPEPTFNNYGLCLHFTFYAFSCAFSAFYPGMCTLSHFFYFFAYNCTPSTITYFDIIPDCLKKFHGLRPGNFEPFLFTLLPKTFFFSKFFTPYGKSGYIYFFCVCVYIYFFTPFFNTWFC